MAATRPTGSHSFMRAPPTTRLADANPVTTPAGCSCCSFWACSEPPPRGVAWLQRGHRSLQLSLARRGGAGREELEDDAVPVGPAQRRERLRGRRARRQRGGEIGWDGGVAL